MTDEKVCWISLASEITCECLKEKCMAWVPVCPESLKDDNRDCDGDDCLDNDREYLDCKGGCRLI